MKRVSVLSVLGFLFVGFGSYGFDEIGGSFTSIDLTKDFSNQTIQYKAGRGFDLVLVVSPFSKGTPVVKVLKAVGAAQCNVLGVKSELRDLDGGDVHSWNQYEITYTVRVETQSGGRGSSCSISVSNPSLNTSVDKAILLHVVF
ncbi:MAG: hypothetical protein HY072_08475 [Deltaproteobacteria bacterium]|nr:hypothetical protein [Deltaproteobacteria bacterium]